MVLQPVMHGSLLHRYTTEHVVEYLIVVLFFWGVVDILQKLLAFPAEMMALRHDWLPRKLSREPVTNGQSYLEQIRSRPLWLKQSRIGRRLDEALAFTSDAGTADEYREHLQYLAEQGDESQQANYTLLRFIVAISPILGFFGTVVHYGTALGGFSLENMATRLPTLVGDMGTAFNTTTVALATTVTMTLAMFACERVDNGILRSVNRLVERELANRFEIKGPQVTPFLHAIEAANREATRAIEARLQEQVAIWSESLDELFQRFDGHQQRGLIAWQETLADVQKRYEKYDAQHAERFRQSVASLEAQQERHLAQVHTMLEGGLALREEFHRLAKALESLSATGGQLHSLQASLADNLQVLHQTQQIDKALHGLTAAIHLLTAHHRPTIMNERSAA
jgi:biopolymer transport protein ExbB/TolQ